MATKTKRLFSGIEESLDVLAATVSTGWVPGQPFQLNTATGNAEPADGTMFYGAVLEDDLDLELGSASSGVATFPESSYTTGPLAPAGAINKVTLVHGSNNLLQIDSALAADNTVLWDTSIESANYGADVFVNGGVWTSTAYASGRPVAKLRQPPTAANGYQLKLKFIE